MTGDEPDGKNRRISVVDAVCCVYFCAAGKSSLLIAILARLGLEILIPEEVEREVLGKRDYGQLPAHWKRMKASEHVQILPGLVQNLPESTRDDWSAEVVATVVRLRKMSISRALSTFKDLGEAVVIGHAKYLADRGHDVYVLIDDGGGRVLAAEEGLKKLRWRIYCSSRSSSICSRELS